MLPNVNQQVGVWSQKRRLLVCLALLLLACKAFVPQKNPTPTPVIIRYQLQAAVVLAQDGATPTNVPLQLSTLPTLPPPVPSPRPGPSPTDTLEPTATPITQPTPSNTPASVPTTASTASSPTLSTLSGYQLGTGILPGNQAVIIAPHTDFALHPDQNHLEFKWEWHKGNNDCNLPEGYGFEIRIWPDPNNDHLTSQTKIEPLGAMNAVEKRELIANSCTIKTGAPRYNYILEDLKGAEGLKRWTDGTGMFYWQVVYAQLDPYSPLWGSAPQSFFIPPVHPGSPPPTPTLTPTPFQPTLPANPAPPPGVIILKDPENGLNYPANISQVEFKWQWASSVLPPPTATPVNPPAPNNPPPSHCQQLLGPEFGFEVRVWSASQLERVPLGVIDAVTEQEKICCNIETKECNLTVLEIKTVPGVTQTYVDTNRWDGKFRWDVALVRTVPYLPPVFASEPSHFDILLSEYTGSIDPCGVQLTCGDMPSWIEAQAIYRKSLGCSKGDPKHDLDKAEDGYVCNNLR